MTWIEKTKKWLLVVSLIGLALLVIPRLEFLTAENIAARVEISIWVAAFGFFFLYVIKGLIMIIPSSLLYVSAALAFPTWAGILITYIGLTISLSIGYMIGKRLGEEKVTKMLSKHKTIEGFVKGKKENMLSLCFFARMFHMPFGIVSLFLGALNMQFHKYIFVSLLGISPVMLFVMFAGALIVN